MLKDLVGSKFKLLQSQCKISQALVVYLCLQINIKAKVGSAQYFKSKHRERIQGLRVAEKIFVGAAFWMN